MSYIAGMYLHAKVCFSTHILRGSINRSFCSISKTTYVIRKRCSMSISSNQSCWWAKNKSRDTYYNFVFRVKVEANFISSGSKTVKCLRCRQYDPAIIERTIGLVLGPFTALLRSFLKRCTLTNKGLYYRPCLNLLMNDRVLIPVPSDC